MLYLLLLFAVWDHSYTTSVTVTYDDNAFAYSNEYINDFMDQIRAYRFPFETYDDFFTEPSLDARIRKKIFGNRTTTFNFGILVRHHVINREKDFQRFVVGLRQSFGTWALKISYRTLPHYLTRYYRDPADSDTHYIACGIAYHTLSGKVTFDPIEDFHTALFYSYSVDNYTAAFDVYDANGHTFGLNTTSMLSNSVNAILAYNFKTSTLRSKSEPAPDREEAIPDGAYNQHTIESKLKIKGLARLPATFLLGYQYSFRDYRSDDPQDRMHYGRQEEKHRFSVKAEIKIKTGMKYMIGYSYTKCLADSWAFPEITTIKNFDRNRVSTGISFYY